MSDQTLPKAAILVLGAGELGACVLRELAKLRQAGDVGAISVLLRPGSASYATMMRELDINIVEADLATAQYAACRHAIISHLNADVNPYVFHDQHRHR